MNDNESINGELVLPITPYSIVVYACILFSAECTIEMVRGLTALRPKGTMAIRCVTNNNPCVTHVLS